MICSTRCSPLSQIISYSLMRNEDDCRKRKMSWSVLSKSLPRSNHNWRYLVFLS
jgi:hypothetical protein